MSKKELIPQSPIDAIAGGYRAAQVLIAANRLGVFPALEEGTNTTESLAEFLGASPRGIRILCDALVSLGLLEKVNEVYRNSPLAYEYLLPGSPKSQVAILNHTARLYEKWGKLYDAVKSGTKVPDEVLDPRLLNDERSFALAMADVGRLSAKQMVEALDLSGVRNLLDVGGGPGLYAIEFARAVPELHATIFDDEKTLEIAKENIERAGLSDRVSVRAGDALQDEFGEGYDFILLSNFVHIYSYGRNREIVQKCARALLPGGQICLKDFFLDSDRTSPAWCALFAVNMLVGTEEGNCYTFDEVREWLENAGLALESIQDMAAQSKVIFGRKPSA